jgi:POT family proton-dependent oligopeptide transporter
MTSATLAAAPARSDKMPSSIPYIVANEFAERFCFYGINAILVAYMIDFLKFGDAQAATWQALFKSGAYFFPLLGAMVSDIFLAKFRTIISFSMVYVAGCFVIAFGGANETSLILGMFLVAFGTGGIKPCVSTNVGDQFTSANQHLIERAFSYFYIAINAGSSISIYFCPEWLADPELGPKVAFGVPGAMMAFATLVFWMGRRKFAVVPAAMSKPGFALVGFFAVFFAVLAFTGFVFMASRESATLKPFAILIATFTLLGTFAGVAALLLGTNLKNSLPAELRQWLERSLTSDGLKIVGKLLGLYLFVAFFWSLWDQSNGNSWTIQAQSALMDKRLFGFLEGIPMFAGLAAYEMLPAQVQVVNGLFILILVPIFTFGIYPLMGKFFEVTPLRKIGIGFFVVAASFVIVAWIEARIQAGETVSMWWQISAYAVLTAAEVLVSITALEYSYKQAPLYMKSFIMALFLLSTSVGNAFTAAVNTIMIKPLAATQIEAGAETWVSLPNASAFVTGQKIDFGGDTGIAVVGKDGKTEPLAGTFLVGEVDATGNRVRLLDKVYRQPISSTGSFDAAKAEVSTYSLVGPVYFLFFSALMAGAAVLFIFYALWFKETTFVREDEKTA